MDFSLQKKSYTLSQFPSLSPLDPCRLIWTPPTPFTQHSTNSLHSALYQPPSPIRLPTHVSYPTPDLSILVLYANNSKFSLFLTNLKFSMFNLWSLHIIVATSLGNACFPSQSCNWLRIGMTYLKWFHLDQEYLCFIENCCSWLWICAFHLKYINFTQ